MNNNIKEYLDLKGINFKESNGELITKCIFSNCDIDSRGNEGHLYFKEETGQYNCKKCNASGNLITLKKHFNDPISTNSDQIKRNVRKITPTMVENYHNALPDRIIQYLNSRGISNEIINQYKLGYINQYDSSWIAIPIKDIDGNYSFFKLRQDPEYGNKKMTWPNGEEAQIYKWDSLLMAYERILITEGEMDALLMKSKGIPCITGTHGAGTTKDNWMEYFKPEIEYYICYDNDNAGKNGAIKMADKLIKNNCEKVFIINLPEEVGDKGDLGDYVVRLGLPIDDLFNKYAKPYPERIDTSEFKEIEIQDVCKVLDATIKKDDDNKAITFLSMLATYTEESQMNIIFNAPSSTGKSHIALSVADLFPKEDKIILAHCSPTAFFHEQGNYDKEKNEIKVDLSRKILIFTDMQDTKLLERLRSILSHDTKESRSKITDKSEKGGNRTKTVVLIGYPSVYYCSAGFKIDEQESTRCLMLSPSIECDKIKQGIQQSIYKESNREKFMAGINSNPERILLMKRVMAIKQEKINDVKIENIELIEELFFKDSKNTIPRQQRDIKKIITLIKGFSLLNIWFRKREADYIWATNEDIINAFNTWKNISYGQDYGLPPYLFGIYMNVIMPICNEPEKSNINSFTENTGSKNYASRKEILKKHYEIYKRQLSMASLKYQILPQLEQVGLIMQEKSIDDKREMLVIPLETGIEEGIYSDDGCGVKSCLLEAEGPKEQESLY